MNDATTAETGAPAAAASAAARAAAAAWATLQPAWGARVGARCAADGLRLEASAGALRPLAHALATSSELALVRPIDCTVVDQAGLVGAAARYAVCWQVGAVHGPLRVRLRLQVAAPTVPSLCAVWPAMAWLEREAYDLFGVTFVDHPQLQRILLPPDFTAHPSRRAGP